MEASIRYSSFFSPKVPADLVVDHQSRGECAHDVGQSDQLGQRRHQEAVGDGEDHRHRRRAGQADEPHERDEEQPADDDRPAQEAPRLEDDQQDRPHGNLDRAPGVGRVHQAEDDRQHDEAKDVVHHRGAQDEVRLGRIQPADVLEHAGGQPDAGRRQRGPQKQMHVPRPATRQEDGRQRVAERDRGDDAQHCHRDGGGANRQQLVELALEPHLEQQKDYADLCRDGQERGGTQGLEDPDASQSEVAQDDPDDEFAEHGGLIQSLDQLAPDLRGHQDGGEGQKEQRHVARAHVFGAVLRAGRPPRAEDQHGDEDPTCRQESAVGPLRRAGLAQ